MALVGYTNAGKSTLFNRLTGSDVLSKDMLFATLDPTMREIDLPGGASAILSDTVGFIADLPTQLVAAFRATLEDVLDADLILHVRDISHPETELQAQNVRGILADLGVETAEGGPVVEVWNKIDRLDPAKADALAVVAARTGRVCAISALAGQGLGSLRSMIEGELREPIHEETIHLDFDEGRRRAWLFDRNVVVAETQTEDGYDIAVRWSDLDRTRYASI